MELGFGFCKRRLQWVTVLCLLKWSHILSLLIRRVHQCSLTFWLFAYSDQAIVIGNCYLWVKSCILQVHHLILCLLPFHSWVPWALRAVECLLCNLGWRWMSNTEMNKIYFLSLCPLIPRLFKMKPHLLMEISVALGILGGLSISLISPWRVLLVIMFLSAWRGRAALNSWQSSMVTSNEINKQNSQFSCLWALIK